MAAPFENIGIKLVALVLGLLLWFHVATEKEYHHEVTLPVTGVLLTEELTLSREPPDSLMVAVSASGKQLLRQGWQRRGVRINANKFSAGRHQLTLSTANVSLVDPDGEVVLDKVVSPTSVNLVVDRIAVDTVPVTLDLTPLTDEGYAVKSISKPEPARVAITGPRSIIGSIQTVFTESKTLSKLRNSVELTLPLVSPEAYGIEVDPDSVQARIEIVPVRTRIIEDVPVAVFNAPVDSTAVANPPYVQVTITGPPEEVEDLPPGSVVLSADYNDITEDGYVPVDYDVPVGIKVKRIQPDSVRIVVRP
jgi:YbbR domain-containing protein